LIGAGDDNDGVQTETINDVSVQCSRGPNPVMLTRPQSSRPRPRPETTRPRPTKTKTVADKTYLKTKIIAPQWR